MNATVLIYYIVVTKVLSNHKQLQVLLIWSQFVVAELCFFYTLL
jgi:hypothetical protein